MYMYEETNIYDEIKNYRNLIRDKKAELEKAQLIVDSLTETMVHRVRSLFSLYSENMLHEAWSQQNKPKSERKMFDFVKGDLFERLFDKEERKEAKFKSISTLGYDSCVYNFYFTYKGINFDLVIPNVKVAKKENIWDMSHGMYRLTYEKNSGFWYTITESYNLDDFALEIQKFVEDRNEQM